MIFNCVNKTLFQFYLFFVVVQVMPLNVGVAHQERMQIVLIHFQIIVSLQYRVRKCMPMI